MTRDAAIEPSPSTGPDRRARSAGPARPDPLLSVEEERELAGRIKAGNQAAREHLILANLGLVVGIARRYRSQGLSLEDLIQEGNLGLIRASEDFDPEVHGCRFSTYAEIWIRAYLHRALTANESLIRLPEHVLRLRDRCRRALDLMGGGGMGSDPGDGAGIPSLDEIARELGVSTRRLRPVYRAGGAPASRAGDEGGGEVLPLTEAIVEDRAPDREAAEHEQRLLLEIALRRLNPVEAWVLRERYGIDVLIPDARRWADPAPRPAGRRDRRRAPIPDADPPNSGRAYFRRTYLELARDCGLSKYRVQQVEAAALVKLREVLGPCLAPAI